LFGKKKENEKPTTLEEVKQAYENLSDDDKKSFNEYHQSIAERVHESVASEREHAQEDSQSAEASEHEALDEEHAEGKGDVEELHEQDAPEKVSEEASEDEVSADSQDGGKEEDNRNEIIERLTDRVNALEEALKEFGTLKEKMDEYIGKQEKFFGLQGKVIGGTSKNIEDMSASELKDAILSGQNN
jgi:hypothetical protein